MNKISGGLGSLSRRIRKPHRKGNVDGDGGASGPPLLSPSSGGDVGGRWETFGGFPSFEQKKSSDGGACADSAKIPQM